MADLAQRAVGLQIVHGNFATDASVAYDPAAQFGDLGGDIGGAARLRRCDRRTGGAGTADEGYRYPAASVRG